jgi:hypothetical protein
MQCPEKNMSNSAGGASKESALGGGGHTGVAIGFVELQAMLVNHILSTSQSVLTYLLLDHLGNILRRRLVERQSKCLEGWHLLHVVLFHGLLRCDGLSNRKYLKGFGFNVPVS